MGNMDMKLYKKIIKELSEMGIKELHLQNFGEPLFDKNIFKKIKMAHNLGMKTVIFTNASLFDNKKIRDMIKSDLDELFISFEGYNKKKFESIRKGLKYNTVSENIKKIYITKKKLKSPTPKIILNVVTIESHKNKINSFRKKWSKYSDSINFQKIHNWSETMIRGKSPGICNTFWNYITVSWDGKIFSCCLDWDGRYIMGDSKKDRLSKIWNNSKYRSFRRMMLYGRIKEIQLCKFCSAMNEDNIYTEMIRFYIKNMRGRK
jgi:radical SAM protein with 4Fe4S-binding SPASM domain